MGYAGGAGNATPKCIFLTTYLPWLFTQVIKLLKDSAINHWGNPGFRWLYWHLLLPGRPPFATKYQRTRTPIITLRDCLTYCENKIYPADGICLMPVESIVTTPGSAKAENEIGSP